MKTPLYQWFAPCSECTDSILERRLPACLLESRRQFAGQPADRERHHVQAARSPRL